MKLEFKASREHADPSMVVATAEKRKKYRVHTTAVMLTYNGIQDKDQRTRFLVFVRTRLRSWVVKHWCCTLEASCRYTLQIHLYVQFHRQVDKTTQSFIFDGISPRVDTNDLLGKAKVNATLGNQWTVGFLYLR